jgi:hypothetical protein
MDTWNPRQLIVDFLVHECVPYDLTGKQTFNNIATELRTRFKHDRRGQTG